MIYGVYYSSRYNSNTLLNGEGALGEANIFCGSDAKLCPDGSIAYRNPLNSCNFKECPVLEHCDSEKICGKGYCYKFENDDKAYCFQGNPCNKCDMGRCDLTRSNPIEVVCDQ